MLEEILVVDREDIPQAFVVKDQVHKENLPHRSVQVYIIQEGKVWIQQRPLDKKFGGKFEPIGGHVNIDDHEKDNEGYIPCAIREVIEEAGIESRDYVEILQIPASEQTGNEFNRVYRLRTNLTPKPNSDETIPEGSYFRTPAEIETIIKQGQASPSLAHTWPLIKEKLR
tara:strand:- start:126 stop:635 length:510 start_codon:yes stop_codon:yes gene_type:complete